MYCLCMMLPSLSTCITCYIGLRCAQVLYRYLDRRFNKVAAQWVIGWNIYKFLPYLLQSQSKTSNQFCFPSIHEKKYKKFYETSIQRSIWRNSMRHQVEWNIVRYLDGWSKQLRQVFLIFCITEAWTCDNIKSWYEINSIKTPLKD